MNFLQEDTISENDSPAGSYRARAEPITLDITYDDPELHSLVSVTSSEWDNENLRDSLMQGRLRIDLWALGLPAPDAITSLCTVDNHSLCVQAVVTCSEMDLSSLSDPTNKYCQQLKIKSITIVQRSPRPNLAASDRKSPITTVYDYYRRSHLQEGPSPCTPLASILPFVPISTWELNQKDSKSIVDHMSAIDAPHKDWEGLEKRLFATELELALQTRRLRDAQRELQQCQARVNRLASQLKGEEHEPVSAEGRFGEGAGVTAMASVDHAAEHSVANESHTSKALEAQEIAGDDYKSDPQSCVRCELRSHSAMLSELHLHAMELRVGMFERRQTETESHAVRLSDALQSERRLRLGLEAELVAERHKRRGAEAMAEAIAGEARWPFIVPDMLDIFLKLEGMVEEVNRESKEVKP